MCPQGHYCPEASEEAIACDAGTYQDKFGATAVTDCLECPEGYTCTTEALKEPVDNCSGGSYCIDGDTFPCDEGFYCPDSSYARIPCAPGTFATETGKSSCDTCTAGFYCGGSEYGGDPSAIRTDPVACPRGYYCPPGTASANEHPCPRGTYAPADIGPNADGTELNSES